MKRAFTPGLQIKSDALIRRIRELPVKGRILKKPGEKVEAADIVAQAELPGDLHILKIAEKMGLEPEEVSAGLKVKAGQQVSAGESLCEHAGLFGLFKSRFLSPYDGLIEIITERTGHVGIRLAPRPVSVRAYLSGEVVGVEDGKSVTIESRAAFVQGIFGVGGEQTGVLKRLNVAPDAVIDSSNIPVEIAGTILFGGMRPDGAALKLAAERGARGFVTGSVDDRALADYLGYDIGIAMTGDEDLSMTLIITEGFGKLPMSRRSCDILAALEGHAASINGATQVRAGAVRPEVIISNTDRKSKSDIPDSALEHAGLSVGTSVRIIRYPWFGEVAEVVELPHESQKIDTGAFTRVLRAKLVSGKTVTVPRANVELV